ncbi:hypothetical protein SpCBS45565_g00344 [Spizellomyces sp. 'palustris']|nr:hypothetical protein SpCBS45565_g00344 [Spizellomyces sp. 'palustris']
MSEYWVSNKKYFCKYCRIYIQDNKISRQTHENGRKHKDNINAYLQDVHKRQEEQSQEDEKTRAMIARIEQAASKQYAQDTRSKPDITAWDPTVEAAKAHKQVYVPDPEKGRPKVIPDAVHPTRPLQPVSTTHDDEHPYGTWAVIDTPPPPSGADPTQNQKGKDRGEAVNEWADYGEEEPEEHVASFKVKEKTLSTDTGEEDAAGLATATFKKRKMTSNKASRNIRKRTD